MPLSASNRNQVQRWAGTVDPDDPLLVEALKRLGHPAAVALELLMRRHSDMASPSVRSGSHAVTQHDKALAALERKVADCATFLGGVTGLNDEAKVLLSSVTTPAAGAGMTVVDLEVSNPRGD